jgi:hypothetical protein
MIFDNALNNIKRSRDEDTYEIPRSTQRIAEYFNQTYDVVYSIHSTPFNITK